MIAYEMNPSSGRVVVDRILDIRPAAYNEHGNVKSGYKLPDELKGRHFVGQIGVVPKHGKVYVFIQPRGVYLPDFEYGPITGRILVHKTQVELKGDYERFPTLQRYKDVFTREISEDSMQPVEQRAFDVLNSHVQSGPLTEELVDELMHDPDFCKALAGVFETVGFKTSFATPTTVENAVLETSA